jgi:SulP family sulfate permease
MAYAMLAGVPPVVGLYAATLPLVLYALVGSARSLAVGPAALIALMTGNAVATFGATPAARVPAARTLAGLVGLCLLAFWGLSLHRVDRLLTRPILVGFSSAVALLIAGTQARPLLGLPAAGWQLAAVHLPTLGLSALTLALLVALRRWAPRWPRALLALVLGATLVRALKLKAAGVTVVGEVPAGLPVLHLDLPPAHLVLALLPSALTIAVVSYVISITVARAFARRGGSEIDPARELLGIGLANAGAALVGAFPVAGGFGRTAVNTEAGARTPLASLVSALLLTGTLLFLTPLFHDLPRAVLSAIIVVAVLGLVEVREAVRLWREERAAALEAWVTFGGTMLLGVELGLLAGVLWGLGRRGLAWARRRGSGPPSHAG